MQSIYLQKPASELLAVQINRVKSGRGIPSIHVRQYEARRVIVIHMRGVQNRIREGSRGDGKREEGISSVAVVAVRYGTRRLDFDYGASALRQEAADCPEHHHALALVRGRPLQRATLVGTIAERWHGREKLMFTHATEAQDQNEHTDSGVDWTHYFSCVVRCDGGRSSGRCLQYNLRIHSGQSGWETTELKKLLTIMSKVSMTI